MGRIIGAVASEPRWIWVIQRNNAPHIAGLFYKQSMRVVIRDTVAAWWCAVGMSVARSNVAPHDVSKPPSVSDLSTALWGRTTRFTAPHTRTESAVPISIKVVNGGGRCPSERKSRERATSNNWRSNRKPRPQRRWPQSQEEFTYLEGDS